MGQCSRKTYQYLPMDSQSLKIGVFPGSFDPITLGHVEVIKQALPLFDKIIVAIGINQTKKTLFSISQRKKWIEQCFADEKKIEVKTYRTLTVDFCKQVQSQYIIRGIRNTIDFQYEKDIAQTNAQLNPTITTIFFATTPELAHISSSMVRDIFMHRGNYHPFVPKVCVLDE